MTTKTTKTDRIERLKDIFKNDGLETIVDKLPSHYAKNHSEEFSVSAATARRDIKQAIAEYNDLLDNLERHGKVLLEDNDGNVDEESSVFYDKVINNDATVDEEDSSEEDSSEDSSAEEDITDVARFDALNGMKDRILYADNEDYRNAFDEVLSSKEDNNETDMSKDNLVDALKLAVMLDSGDTIKSIVEELLEKHPEVNPQTVIAQTYAEMEDDNDVPAKTKKPEPKPEPKPAPKVATKKTKSSIKKAKKDVAAREKDTKVKPAPKKARKMPKTGWEWSNKTKNIAEDDVPSAISDVAVTLMGGCTSKELATLLSEWIGCTVGAATSRIVTQRNNNIVTSHIKEDQRWPTLQIDENCYYDKPFCHTIDGDDNEYVSFLPLSFVAAAKLLKVKDQKWVDLAEDCGFTLKTAIVADVGEEKVALVDGSMAVDVDIPATAAADLDAKCEKVLEETGFFDDIEMENTDKDAKDDVSPKKMSADAIWSTIVDQIFDGFLSGMDNITDKIQQMAQDNDVTDELDYITEHVMEAIHLSGM